MTDAISAVNRATSPTAPLNQPLNAQKKAVPAATQPVSTTTVSISSAAKTAAAQEAAETPAQTAQEARGNDRQAQHLIARQAAASHQSK